MSQHTNSTPAPTTLEQLQDYLREGVNWEGAPMKHGELDWTSLPTFGGEAPADTEGVWSWDETRQLVGTCAADVMLEERPDCGITDRSLRDLRSQAAEHDDIVQVALCNLALGYVGIWFDAETMRDLETLGVFIDNEHALAEGRVKARQLCAQVISDARGAAAY